jgi:hypothetical protein
MMRPAYCLPYKGDDYRPDNKGSKHLWNVGQFLRDKKRYIQESCHLDILFLYDAFWYLRIPKSPKASDVSPQFIYAFLM